jgi:branched-chain amino acid transport system ATP-binding protein
MTSTVEKYRLLLLATLATIALPCGLYLLGLSFNTGTMVVALAIAAMGLNLCIGYTGLVSFGHGAWFGIGAYAAGLIQRNWFGGDIFLPLLLAAVIVAVIATFVGFVILRRRGVYFSLLTLALSALAYTIAFRWTAVTGGEDGLGGLKRGSIGAFSWCARRSAMC